MNQFVPRIDGPTVDRSAPAVRVVPAVASIDPGQGRPDSAGGGNVGAGTDEQSRREQMASAFDYARVQARVADILSELATGGDTPPAEARAAAQAQVEALRPEPMVVIPMPPASVEAIERAIAVARAMASQVAMTRSAQANVATSTVAQILAA